VTARDAGAAPRCTGEPVSWLALERLRLGELPPDQRRPVEQHLAECAACAACLAEIDRPLALPALSVAPSRVTWWSRLRAAWRGARPAHIAMPASFAVLLALVMLARPRPIVVPLSDGTLSGIKGDGVALALVRERDGAIDHDATRFASRDRWKALVTCPSARVLFWDVAVFDGGNATFPLEPAGPIACGNRVPLPGAFKLDGEHLLEVCVLLAADPIDRVRLTAHAGTRATCVALQPER
jgi:hypothetical protein